MTQAAQEVINRHILDPTTLRLYWMEAEVHIDPRERASVALVRQAAGTSSE